MLEIRRWISLLAVLTMGGLIQFALAQDTPSPEAATFTVTEVPLGSPEITTEPVPLTLSSTPLQLAPTVQPETPTAQALDISPAPVTSVSLTPTSTIVTQPFTLTPSSSASPTSDTIALARLSLLPGSKLPGAQEATLMVAAEGLSQVYSFALVCQADPRVLIGSGSAPGTLFAPHQIMLTDGGFQSNGRWVLAVAQIPPAPEVNGSGILWQLNYHFASAEPAQITCAVTLADLSGQPLPLENSEITIILEREQVTGTPSPTPGIDQMLATIELPSETPASATITPTLIPPTILPEMVTTTSLSELCGQIELSNTSQQAALTIRSIAIIQTLTIPEDGTFCTALPPGHYQLMFHAHQHLPLVSDVHLNEAGLTLSNIRLIGGDVNGDGFVNMLDVDLVMENFGLTVPPAMPAADLNGDQRININDLSIVSAHIPEGTG